MFIERRDQQNLDLVEGTHSVFNIRVKGQKTSPSKEMMVNWKQEYVSRRRISNCTFTNLIEVINEWRASVIKFVSKLNQSLKSRMREIRTYGSERVLPLTNIGRG